MSRPYLRPSSGHLSHFIIIAGLSLAIPTACIKPTMSKVKDIAEADDGIADGAKYIQATFKATAKGKNISAEDGGGREVDANRDGIGYWEQFVIVDRNGGTLKHNDPVYIKTSADWYLTTADGGGGTLYASSRDARSWEKFRIIRKDGDGDVKSGDQIALQTLANGSWVSVDSTDMGTLNARAKSMGATEMFTISLGAVTDTPPPPANGWKMVWNDEFNGPGIDETKWGWEVQPPKWVNNELQNYTDHRSENARIENGTLVIEARRDNFGGEYSSARIKTQGKAGWTYGRFEARMKLPSGWGTWPAFWMMPEDFSRGWPGCGEIDIMEHVGYDINVLHGTTHSEKYNWKGVEQRTAQTGVERATDDFHIYAVEWTDAGVDFIVDDRKYFTSPNDKTGDAAWPFNKNFYIIFNLAVGGDWGGAQGVDPNIWPKSLIVDYVRVFQR